MIEFMVIGAARSGTTWAANWLTTDTTLCLHDPIATKHYSDWDNIKSTKMLGISDTGISQFWQWLNTHPARKLIVHRDMLEIADSIGIPEIANMDCHLDKIYGMHCHYLDLFNNPKDIYEYLLEKEFDPERHSELKAMNIQPMTESMVFDKTLVSRLIQEMKGAQSCQ